MRGPSFLPCPLFLFSSPIRSGHWPTHISRYKSGFLPSAAARIQYCCLCSAQKKGKAASVASHFCRYFGTCVHQVGKLRYWTEWRPLYSTSLSTVGLFRVSNDRRPTSGVSALHAESELVNLRRNFLEQNHI